MAEEEERPREWVRDYFDSQSHGDPAVHVEKATTENVGGQVYDVWDVSTKSGRWWVVSNPMNLYAQEDFKSRDVVLTFHIGLMMRVSTRHRPPINELPAMLLDEPWARWDRAVASMTSSAHAEDFQSVSLRLRECLISLAELLADASLVPKGEKVPKTADGPGWFKLYAARMAPGSSESRLRGYLSDLATRTWDLSQNVTHKRQALFQDAEIAVAAVSHLLSTFTAARMRWERQGNRRCPEVRLLRRGRGQVFPLRRRRAVHRSMERGAAGRRGASSPARRTVHAQLGHLDLPLAGRLTTEGASSPPRGATVSKGVQVAAVPREHSTAATGPASDVESRFYRNPLSRQDAGITRRVA